MRLALGVLARTMDKLSRLAGGLPARWRRTGNTFTESREHRECRRIQTLLCQGLSDREVAERCGLTAARATALRRYYGLYAIGTAGSSTKTGDGK